MAGLNPQGLRQATFAIDLLVLEGALLGEPHSRQLSGKLRELRVRVASRPVRITYFIDVGGKIVLLTVFEKTGRREPAEIRRAERMLVRYLDEN